MSNSVKGDLQKIIDALLECETKGRSCKKCKLRRNGCLLFVRDSLAVALQFILSGMDESDTPHGLYS